MSSPISKQYKESENQDLVRQTLAGDRNALDKLIKIHQPFIYNVAWKMAHNPDDALDLTQETLIKVITKLSQFNFKSSFRTWLYRIVVNEFLQTKRRNAENRFVSFDDYGSKLDAIPNAELNKEEELAHKELSEEMKMSCMSGMLMCLNREQRLIYILGDTFSIDHNLGAEIFEISPQNFRVKLFRARQDLYNFMNQKCGLVNTTNPCRCPKKAKSLKQMGLLNEEKMVFNALFTKRIGNYVQKNYHQVDEAFDERYTQLFQTHSIKSEFDAQTLIDEVLNDEELMKHFK
ncbi:MAG: RNA polymerase sigma factor [Bacteroidia bacterium]|nr:RNA polymerase sigma factor [Bacteroidia bacterium]